MVLLHEAVAAQHLHGVCGDVHGSFCGDELGLGGRGGEELVVILVTGGLVDHVLGHLNFVGQVHHPEGQVLVLVQGLLELLPLHQVLPGDFKGALGDAQSLGEAMPMRPPSRVFIAAAKPLPGGVTMLATGT